MPTPSQTVGPFFGFALRFDTGAEAVPAGSADAVRLEGQVFDGAGDVVPDALLEVWQGDQFARCRTDADGAFHFTVRKPAATAQAPFLNVTVLARGLLRQLVTRIYFPGEEEANGADPVLQRVEIARRGTLIARPGGGALHFDVRLQGEGETVFFEI